MNQVEKIIIKNLMKDIFLYSKKVAWEAMTPCSWKYNSKEYCLDCSRASICKMEFQIQNQIDNF
jgi:hypothetical protein